MSIDNPNNDATKIPDVLSTFISVFSYPGKRACEGHTGKSTTLSGIKELGFAAVAISTRALSESLLSLVQVCLTMPPPALLTLVNEPRRRIDQSDLKCLFRVEGRCEVSLSVCRLGAISGQAGAVDVG